MQSTFEAFAPAEIAYRREQITADFARAGWRSPRRRHHHHAPRTAVARAFTHLHANAGASS
jgi:hypothetical protein